MAEVTKSRSRIRHQKTNIPKVKLDLRYILTAVIDIKVVHSYYRVHMESKNRTSLLFVFS
jgi:hypothetical protein